MVAEVSKTGIIRFFGQAIFISCIEMAVSLEGNTFLLGKVVLIGDSGVGKSCLMTRISDNQFTTSFVATIGMDFRNVTFDVENRLLKMQIWDTAGQERFRTLTKAYFRYSRGVVLVYDVTDEQSFQNIRSWMQQIREHAPEEVNKILIGNKCDMVDHKVIDTARGQALADEFGIKFFETSAKHNLNVKPAFFEVAQEIFGRYFGNEVLKKEKEGAAGVPIEQPCKLTEVQPKSHRCSTHC